jgi:glyoxylase I family protein
MRLHHLAIQVTDLDVARQFYCDTLGLTEVRRQAHAIWIDAGGTIVMLERCAGSDSAGGDWPSDAPGPFVVAFAIAPGERDSWRDRLERAGVSLSHSSAYTLYFRDPFGTRLALSHYPDQGA